MKNAGLGHEKDVASLAAQSGYDPAAGRSESTNQGRPAGLKIPRLSFVPRTVRSGHGTRSRRGEHMAPTQDRGEVSGPLGHLVKLGRRILGTETEQTEAPERRASQRIPLRLPVDACLEGSKFQESKLVDVSLRGLALDLAEEGAPGQRVSVRFRKSQAGEATFLLQGRVVRVLDSSPERVGVNVPRTENPPEALESYRRLILFYLRNRTLLEELNSGVFEGRCAACNWVGHVAEQSPSCPMCHGSVERAGT
jgi:hypothetical protein